MTAIKKVLLATLAVAGSLLSQAGTARAAITTIPAMYCINKGGATGQSSQYGWSNEGGGTLKIWCPIPVSNASPVTIRVNAYDRNNSADVACSIKGIDASGNDIARLGPSTTLGASQSRFTGLLGFTMNNTTGLAIYVECTIPPPDPAFGAFHSAVERIEVQQ